MTEARRARVAAAVEVRDGENAGAAYRERRIAHWNQVARALDRYTRMNRAYHARLHEIYGWLIPPGQRVLEIGCGPGDLLAALRPASGVGVDVSPEMVCVASERHPGLRFVAADAHDLDLHETFDSIVLSDVVNDVWDVQRVFERVRRHSRASTRIVLNFYNRVWELPLRLLKSLGLTRPLLAQNWLTLGDIANLLELADCEVVRHSTEILWPLATPVVAPFCNRVLAKTWPFNLAALTHVVVARPKPGATAVREQASVSIVVPARNEAGNIESIFERTPDLGSGTELVFVEGHSRDATYAEVEAAIRRHPERRAVLIRQRGEGKGDAVREGFAAASGDILMILDADLTVPPEDLGRFYDALVAGKGEFVNGVRLVYPMEDRAMRFVNLVGNRGFSVLFSWLLGQTIKDTLCGTKVLWRRDYQRIAANRSYFGDFDPFGDYDLLFGASKLALKIVEMPVRYRSRTYGDTNIQRWRHGLLLLRMSAVAAVKLKWV
jgi:SAM-dependent methyltransferase